MFLQFLSSKTFTVAKKDIIKIVKGAKAIDRLNLVNISNKSVVEMVDARAKKMLKCYPNDCERWGVDAIEKTPPKKGKNSQPKTGHNKRDIA